jgi:transcriptional regulator with XRE-family HTH domain
LTYIWFRTKLEGMSWRQAKLREEMPVRYSLPVRLRVLRGEKGWTTEQAAKKAGLTYDSLSRIERGVSHPRATTLVRLAKIYGVSPEELMSLEVSPPPLAV